MLFFLSRVFLEQKWDRGVKSEELWRQDSEGPPGASVWCPLPENTVRHHNQCSKTWRPTCRRAEVDSKLASHGNIKSKWIKTLKV